MQTGNVGHQKKQASITVMSHNESDMLHVNKLYRFPLHRVYLYPQFEKDWYIIILVHTHTQKKKKLSVLSSVPAQQDSLPPWPY